MPSEPVHRCSGSRAGSVLAAMLLTLIPEVAQVSMTHAVPITLDDLLERSSHIVVGVPDSLPERTEEVPVVEGGKTYEPYRRSLHRYRVQASLRGGLEQGTLIEVVRHNDSGMERIHRMYVIEGVHRSYYDPQYQPQAKVDLGGALILFISEHESGKRYSLVAGQSVEGLAMRGEIVRRLNLASPEARASAALRAHGKFGDDGDLRSPALPPPPQLLVFRFNHLKLARQGNTTSFTIEPVWQDAQRAPPPDFELGRRSYRMSAEDFAAFWSELNLIDWPRYARVTSADFETTPPDMRHTEWLHYSVNGKDIASWGEGDKWLRQELRAPLLNLERWLTQWADAQPVPAPGAFQRVMLRDVEDLNGGQNVYVYDDGRVLVQVVSPAQGKQGLQERRYAWKLDAKRLVELRQLLDKHPPREMNLSRPGIPGEVQVEIEVISKSGAHIRMRQWADDAQSDFGALHTYLLRTARETKKRKPVREGAYDQDWRPE